MSFLVAATTSKAAADDMVATGDLAEAHSEIKEGGDTPILMHRERAGVSGEPSTTNGKQYDGQVSVNVALMVRDENKSFSDLQNLMFDHLDRVTDKENSMRLDVSSVQMFESGWGRKEVKTAVYTIFRPSTIDVRDPSRFT